MSFSLPEIVLHKEEQLYLLLDGGQIAQLERRLFEIADTPHTSHCICMHHGRVCVKSPPVWSSLLSHYCAGMRPSFKPIAAICSPQPWHCYRLLNAYVAGLKRKALMGAGYCSNPRNRKGCIGSFRTMIRAFGKISRRCGSPFVSNCNRAASSSGGIKPPTYLLLQQKCHHCVRMRLYV